MEVLSRKRITGLPFWAYSPHNDAPKKSPVWVFPQPGLCKKGPLLLNYPTVSFLPYPKRSLRLHSLTQRNKIEHIRLSGLSFAIGPGKKWGRGSTIEVEPEKFGSRCALLGRGYKDLRDGSSFR